MPDILKTTKKAAGILRQNGIAEPRREADSLLAFALGKDKTFLVAYSEYELAGKEEKRFWKFIKRRAKREPFQHITGKQEFYSLDFEVSKDVLIPRPETELIVENAVEILREIDTPKFCEVGVGSGCISVSILSEVKTANAVGLDVSEKALKVATRNAERHEVSGRLKLEISDIFEKLENEKFDLIVSNPPYISLDDFENLQPEVRVFDPKIALTDGKNGFSIIEKIIRESPNFLKSEGFLMLEIGIGQNEKAAAMFLDQIWQSVEFFADLQKIPRMIRARIRK